MANIRHKGSDLHSTSPESSSTSINLRKSPTYVGLRPVLLDSKRPSRFAHLSSDPLYQFPILSQEKRNNSPLGEGTTFQFNSCEESFRGACKPTDFNHSSLSLISIHMQSPSESLFMMSEPQSPSDEEILPEEGALQQVCHVEVPNATKDVQFGKISQAPPPKFLSDSTVEAPSSFCTVDMRLPDGSSPICSKLVSCKCSAVNLLHPTVEVVNSTALSGYLLAVQVEFSDTRSVGFASDTHLNNVMPSPLRSWLAQNEVAWLSCGFEHCLVLTTQSVVLAWGNGQSGCLGIGQSESTQSPKIVSRLTGQGIVYIEAGGYHNAAIANDGTLYMWGRGDVHQIGIPVSQLQEDDIGFVAHTPMPVPFFSDKFVVGVACGEAHSLILDSNGKVYSCGWAEDGQLGLPSNLLQNNIMSCGVGLVNSLSENNVLKVAAGALFSACIDDKGNVFLWGNGEQGQLGQGNCVKFQDFPTSLKIEENAIDIVCGEAHAICLTSEGNLWAWGIGIAGAFEQKTDFEKGSLLSCFNPKRLQSVDIAQRIIIPN